MPQLQRGFANSPLKLDRASNNIPQKIRDVIIQAQNFVYIC